MDDTEIYARLNEIFRQQFGNEEITVCAETKADDVDGWDSLAHIRLVIAIERGFGIKFKTSEVAALRNVGDVVSMIKVKS